MRLSRDDSDDALPPARIALGFAAAALVPLIGVGCTSAPPADRPRFDCYDVRGRIEPTIVTQAECEVRNWFWRERP